MKNKEEEKLERRRKKKANNTIYCTQCDFYKIQSLKGKKKVIQFYLHIY